MDYLLDLEIVGSKLSIFGDKNEILSIIIEHENIVKYRHCMRKEAVFELMNLLKSQLQLEFKVKESCSGLYNDHEILIQEMQIDEKLKHGEYQITEVIDEGGIETKHATLS